MRILHRPPTSPIPIFADTDTERVRGKVAVADGR